MEQILSGLASGRRQQDKLSRTGCFS